MASRTRAITHSRRTILQLGLSAAFAPMAPAIVRAQASDLPPGPIRVILPTLHGGQADTLGRLIGDRVSAAIDRNFVMEPRAGAGGLIAGEYVARAAPDGNTLLFVTGGHTTFPGLYKSTIKFDAVKDFAFISQISESSFAIAVAPDHPAKSFAHLLELSKKEPGRYTFSSTGVGSTQHLIGEVCQERFGVKWTHVPYPGGPGPVNDVIAGRVDMSINSMLTLAPLVNGGKLRALAASSLERDPLLPDTPSFGEISPGFFVGTILGIAAPARTPRPIVERLNREIAKVVNTDAMRERLATMANKAKGGTPEEFTATVAQYVERWSGVIEKLGIGR
jgi:tripartite-type tricarboxylate transporter receptor subunit TctC